MRKVITLMAGFILFFISSSAFANTWDIVTTWALEEASYTYYYGQWCSHCANVDEYMKWVDWYNRVNITKNEIYFDDDNRAAYLEAWKRLWISEADLGIPFLIINNWWEEDFLIWDETIINHFESFLWEAPENPNKWIILIILWVLVILIPLVLIKFSK